ncbi:MAG: DUF362 domain-containing protein [Spirochaetota bacterium]
MKYDVALTRYEGKGSIKKVMELSNACNKLKSSNKVFIKPNIVFWATVPFPKWGIITTSSVLQEVVELVKDCAVRDITTGEGIVTLNPNDRESALHAFEYLGYHTLVKRYGVKVINIFERQFEKVNLDDDISILYTHDGTLPQKLHSMGVKGLSYPKYDVSMCTYCAALNGAVLTAISFAWQGKPWDDIIKTSRNLKKRFTK